MLRLATLRELGGAQEIVRQHLDRVMRAFSPPEMAVLAAAFGHLVTPSGTKIATPRATWRSSAVTTPPRWPR